MQDFQFAMFWFISQGQPLSCAVTIAAAYFGDRAETLATIPFWLRRWKGNESAKVGGATTA